MRLNLGCGFDAREGYTNVDRRRLPGVDVVHDLDCHPWPFEDDSADAILANDIFEHFDDVVAAMDECWRILQARGTLQIRGPLAGGPLEHIDVTHRRAFTERSFDHFDWTTEMGARYRYGRAPWALGKPAREGDNLVFALTPVKNR
jgi:SAM-dependent methyltransferase